MSNDFDKAKNTVHGHGLRTHWGLQQRLPTAIPLKHFLLRTDLT